jgi:hypothetical protein
MNQEPPPIEEMSPIEDKSVGPKPVANVGTRWLPEAVRLKLAADFERTRREWKRNEDW